MAQVGDLLLDRLRVALEGEIRRLNPSWPTVLLAHAMVDTASYGAERFLAAGRGFHNSLWPCWPVLVLIMWLWAMFTATRFCANNR